MARRTKASAEETRELILDAAEIVFHEKGVTRSSLDGIAKHAGCTRGAIYWHFRDKREVFLAMIERMKRMSTAEIQEDLRQDEPADALDVMRRNFIKFSRSLYEDPRRLRLYRTVLFRCEYIDDMHDAVNALLGPSQEWLQLLEALMRKAASLDQLKPDISPEIAALMINTLAVGSFFNNLRGEDAAIDFTRDLAAFDHALTQLRHEPRRGTG